MIDIENDVFGAIAPHIREKYNANVVGEYVDAPNSFPAVTIFQIDNSVIQRMRTTKIENAVAVVFEVNVYTNMAGYKKQQAKDILDDIDEIMSEIGFSRVMSSPASNLADATIYRIVSRYSASVDKDLWIYRNE